MNSRTVVIGSRESRLAVIQSEMVKDYIEKNNEGLKAELLTMKTTGDIILDRTLDKVGGKGLFVKELDRALLDGRSELSVHSLKDMPMEVPDELPLLAFSKREDPRDALVLPEAYPAASGIIPGYGVQECQRKCADAASETGQRGIQRAGAGSGGP